MATSTERVRAHRARKAKEALGAEIGELAGLPNPPSRDELLKVLGAKARNGDNAAIRLLLEEYRRDAVDTDAKPDISTVVSLAERRSA